MFKLHVSCFTNIDECRHEKWPTFVTTPPSVGDTMVSESGKELKIVQIKHLPRGVVHLELHGRRLVADRV